MPDDKDLLAFPQPFQFNGEGNQTYAGAPWARGMTLRDYFAAAALSGMLANQDCTAAFSQGEMAQLAAALAYDHADAMLKTRKA